MAASNNPKHKAQLMIEIQTVIETIYRYRHRVEDQDKSRELEEKTDRLARFVADEPH